MKRFLPTLGLATLVLGATACTPPPATPGKPTVAVTYSLLGSLVQDLVGDAFTVAVVMPDGMDPHEWEPSARDREALQKAVLIVQNGEGLEGGLDEAIDQAAASGIPVFTASDHVDLLPLPEGETDGHGHGTHDPHLWTDPVRMKKVLLALAEDLHSRWGTDLAGRAADLGQRLDALDARVRALVDRVPPADRLLVTGHESLGYFAQTYGLELVGAIVPSLSSRAEVSASDMAALKQAIRNRRVSVIFTELGTPAKVAQALGTEAGLRVVEITTHALGSGTYFTFLEGLATQITGNLRPVQK